MVLSFLKCHLIEDLISWYIWKDRLRPCHFLIKKNVFVNKNHVKNRILNYDSMTVRWRSVVYSSSWEVQEGVARTYCECWGLNNIQSTHIDSWYVSTIREIGENEFETIALDFMDDPKSAEDYLPNIFMRSI